MLIIYFWSIGMFKSKSAKSKTKKSLPWPWRFRGLYIVLGVSLLLNAITLSFVTFLTSPTASYGLLSHSLDQACVRDYDDILVGLESQTEKVLFSEANCMRNVTTGKNLDNATIVNGHYIVR